MTRVRATIFYIRLIIGGILGLFSLGIFLSTSPLTSDYMSSLAGIKAPADPLKAINVQVVNHERPGGAGLKPAYQALTSGHKFNMYRTIKLSTTVPMKALLQKDEEAPGDQLAQAYAKARSAIYIQTECERIMLNLASQCKVDRVNGKVIKNRDGYVRIYAELSFVPKDIPDFSPLRGTMEFVSKETDFKERIARSDTRLQERARKKLYAKLAAYCTPYNTRNTPCSVATIKIQGGDKRRSSSPAAPIQATATYGMLKPL